MSAPSPDDPIAQWLPLLRQRQFQQAQEQLQALQPSLEQDRPALFEGCKLLLQWHMRPHRFSYDEGLSGAITGVSILRDEGYRPLIAWEMASVGYALGLLGDLETGIALLDVALDDIQQLGDVRGEIIFRYNQGGLHIYAHAPTAAENAFQAALVLCEGPYAKLKVGVLNNMSYARIFRARQPDTPEQEKRMLAEQALHQGRAALELAKNDPEYAIHEATILDNIAQSLFLLEKDAASKAYFLEGLSKSKTESIAHFALLIGYAELMMRNGRLDEARVTLQEAVNRQTPHRVGIVKDRLMAAQIELARRSGDESAAHSLWEERLQIVQDQYRERLRRVQIGRAHV